MVPCGSSPVTCLALASAMRKTKRLRRRLHLQLVPAPLLSFLPSYSQTQKTVNTWKISGMLIVYWPISIKFRIRKQTSKPQTNYRCCLWFSYLAPYWLISRNTITFHKYFWCSRFFEFHSEIWYCFTVMPNYKGRTIRKLMGGGGRSTKKKFAQGKIKWKKILARQ